MHGEISPTKHSETWTRESVLVVWIEEHSKRNPTRKNCIVKAAETAIFHIYTRSGSPHILQVVISNIVQPRGLAS